MLIFYDLICKLSYSQTGSHSPKIQTLKNKEHATLKGEKN